MGFLGLAADLALSPDPGRPSWRRLIEWRRLIDAMQVEDRSATEQLHLPESPGVMA